MDTELRRLERDFLMSPNQELLTRMAAALGRAGDTTMASWLQFLAGHWTLKIPTKPGSYFVKTHQHELGMMIHVVEMDGQLIVPSVSLSRQTPSERWGAFWWSEPMPSLPVHTSQDAYSPGMP